MTTYSHRRQLLEAKVLFESLREWIPARQICTWVTWIGLAVDA